MVVDSWKFNMLLLYILWDDWPIFMISASNKQLQQQLEYNLLKPDCHSWWISKMQTGREDTLEEWYAIKFCFKLGKNATAMNQRPRDRVPIGTRLALPDPRRPDRANPPTNIWWSLFLTALAWSTCTGFPLDRQSTRNTMLGFKGDLEEIPWEEASTLQIGSVAFPRGQPQHSNPNPYALANHLRCIDFLTPPTPLIIHHRLLAFLESLMPLKNWCSINARWSKSSLKHSIRFCGIFF